VTQKIVYCLQHYAYLALFLLSILGWGRVVTGKALAPGASIPALASMALQATAGLGLVTLLLFAVASFGQFRPAPLLVVLAIGMLLAAPLLVRGAGMRTPGDGGFSLAHLGRLPSLLLWLALAAWITNVLARPLKVPLGWDEVAYHLPTARAWAASGALVVTDWLRYPLFPFNMELLYAGAIVLADDITAHLVHALAGLLAAALAFSIARLYMPLAFAALAAALPVYATRESMQTADVDLGLMLYVFGAFAALAWRYLTGRRGLLFLSAYFVGLALGTKYQAMFYLPALGIGFLLVERNARTLALAAGIAILAGGFWYVRNAVIAGDPIHPMGGPVFGYWLWNADDMRRQFLDLDGARGMPPWYLLAGIGSLCFWRSAAPLARGCMITTSVAVAAWWVLSGYPRYLMPAYPMLGLLTGYAAFRVLSTAQVARWPRAAWSRMARPLQVAAVVLLLVVVVLDWGKAAKRELRRLVVPYSSEHIAMLTERYPGFALLHSLERPLFGTLYQLGFEDEIDYLGTPVLGDHFGKARYPDVMQLADNPEGLSAHLLSLGAVYLMVNRERYQPEFYAVAANARWPDFFETLQATPRAILFRVRDAAPGAPARVMRFPELTIPAAGCDRAARNCPWRGSAHDRSTAPPGHHSPAL